MENETLKKCYSSRIEIVKIELVEVLYVPFLIKIFKYSKRSHVICVFKKSIQFTFLHTQNW